MKPAQQQHCKILERDGVTFGVTLAADFTSEHEWGVAPLRAEFGMPEGSCLFNKMKMTQGSDRIHRFDLVRSETFYTNHPMPRKARGKSAVLTNDSLPPDDAARLLERYSETAIITGAFDNTRFAVRGFGAKGIAMIGLLEEGFAKHDIAIWMSAASNRFGRGGLTIVRHSLTPADLIQTFDASVLDARKLRAADAATGIRDRVTSGFADKRPGVPFYTLRASWASGEWLERTAHPVIYWLNPSDQVKHRHGWYTVEDLDRWIAGEGPVLAQPRADALAGE